MLIPGFFLILSLQVSGTFAAHFPHQNPPSKNGISPVEMLKRAQDAENHGDYGRAIRIYRQLTPEHEKTFGPEHPNTLYVLTRLYIAYFTSKKLNEALPLGWKIYKITKTLQGEEDERTIELLSGLGKIYHEIGRYEKAEQLLKRAYRLYKSKLGQTHRNTIINLFRLADLYRDSGGPEKWDLIISYYQKVYDVNSKGPKMGTAYELALDALRRVGEILCRQGKFKEATQVFQKVLDISEKTLGENHEITQDSKKDLVNALLRDGKIGQVNKILRKGYFFDYYYYFINILKGFTKYLVSKPEVDKDEEFFYTLIEAKVDALEKQGTYLKAIEILAKFYDHEILKPLVPANFLTVLSKLIKYSRQQGDFEQVIKWASAAVDLVYNHCQCQNKRAKVNVELKVKVKLTSDEHVRDLILLGLNATASLISVYSERNDEEKVDEWFQTAKSIKVIKGQGQGHEGQAVLDKFLSIAIEVAEFKEKIGKTEEALKLYLEIAGTPNGKEESLTALTAIVNSSIKKDDYILLTNIAQKFLQYCQSEQSEPEDMVKLRESVASHLLKNANEDFHFRNYESAFSVLKIVKTIWPKKWEGDFSLTSTFFEGIAMAAFSSKKRNEGFFYLEKAMSLHKEKLTSEMEMEETERERILKKIEYLVRLQNGTENFPKSLNFGEICQGYENVTLGTVSIND